MGTVYYLARDDNHTLFELGKWHQLGELFSELAGPHRGASFELPGEATLRDRIRVAVDDWKDVDRDAYAAECARRITAFADGHVVWLGNDCANDLDHYRDANDDMNVVGSIYGAGAVKQ